MTPTEPVPTQIGDAATEEHKGHVAMATILGVLKGDSYAKPPEDPNAQQFQQTRPDALKGKNLGGDNWQSGNFAHDLLAMMSLPVTYENVRAINAWAQAEGGHVKNAAKFNWLNTTQSAAGATSINSVGVKAYGDYDTGLKATAQTLLNGRYGNILDALRAGNDAHAVVDAVEQSPWGTGGLAKKVLG